MHSVRISPVELRPGQLDKYFLDKRRDLVQHLLELIHFLLLLIHVLLDLDPSLLVLGSVIQDLLFLLVVLLELVVLGPEVLVDVDEVVDFLVEDINIGQKVIVLFLALDEGVLDLEDVGQASCFFDGGKGFIDHLHVSLVIVNQFHFFLIIDDELGQSMLQHSCSVVLDGVDLSSLDPASSVQLGVLEFFVEFSESSVVIGLIFLILHLEAEHQILAHLAGVLTGLDVLHEVVDLGVRLFNIALKRLQVVLVHGLLLSEQVDGSF